MPEGEGEGDREREEQRERERGRGRSQNTDRAKTRSTTATTATFPTTETHLGEKLQRLRCYRLLHTPGSQRQRPENHHPRVDGNQSRPGTSRTTNTTSGGMDGDAARLQVPPCGRMSPSRVNQRARLTRTGNVFSLAPERKGQPRVQHHEEVQGCSGEEACVAATNAAAAAVKALPRGELPTINKESRHARRNAFYRKEVLVQGHRRRVEG